MGERGRKRFRTFTARNPENRDGLDEEFIPSDEGFVRVTRQTNLHVTPRRRRRISPPRDSSSSSADYSPPPLSSSRLQVDFRDLSPGSGGESGGRYTANRARWSRGEERLRSHQRCWGLRYSGEEKESSEQFLSRLKACKQATGIPDEQLLPCLASILVRDAGDWYEVYQDEILAWDFKTFEKAFRRQFVELHDDDVMEELQDIKARRRKSHPSLRSSAGLLRTSKDHHQ